MLESKSHGAAYCLVYRSFASPPWIGHDALSAICRESKENNSRSGTTGVLIFRDGVFLQVIEGGTVDVLGLSARIAADARNERLRILWHGNVARRCFPKWPMGCFVAEAHDPALDPVREWTPSRVHDLRQFYDAHFDLGLKPGFVAARRLT